MIEKQIAGMIRKVGDHHDRIRRLEAVKFRETGVQYAAIACAGAALGIGETKDVGVTGDTLYTNAPDIFSLDGGSPQHVECTVGGCFVVMAGLDTNNDTHRIDIAVRCDEHHVADDIWSERNAVINAEMVSPWLAGSFPDGSGYQFFNQHSIGIYVRNLETGYDKFRFTVWAANMTTGLMTSVDGGGFFVARLNSLPATLSGIGAEPTLLDEA